MSLVGRGSFVHGAIGTGSLRVNAGRRTVRGRMRGDLPGSDRPLRAKGSYPALGGTWFDTNDYRTYRRAPLLSLNSLAAACPSIAKHAASSTVQESTACCHWLHRRPAGVPDRARS